jgi:hypothetical protein
MVESLQGQQLPRAFNGRYLKNFIQVCGRMIEDSWPVFMKIALSIKNGRQEL